MDRSLWRNSRIPALFSALLFLQIASLVSLVSAPFVPFAPPVFAGASLCAFAALFAHRIGEAKLLSRITAPFSLSIARRSALPAAVARV
jgi:hypothetical protein